MARKTAINGAQKNILVEFMREHEELQSGKFTKDFTFKKAQELWEEVTDHLNSVPNGAVKDWRHWRKTWQDLKKNIKSKAVAAKKEATGTGGGEPSKPLSDVDTEILEIIHPAQIDGIDMEEMPVMFDYNMENETIENSPGPSIIEDVHATLDEAQPSTSDHEYTKVSDSVPKLKTFKKINKTTRLKNSLEVSHQLLRSVNKRNELMQEYYKQKTEYYKNKNLYLEKKTEVDICSAICDIRDSLRDLL